MKLVTTHRNLFEAVELANDYFNSTSFKQDVLSQSKFDGSNVLPKEIVWLFKDFEEHHDPIEVKCTPFGWFYRKVLGRTIGDGVIYINSQRLDRTMWSIASTLVHEASHIVDRYYPDASFGHGSNSSNGKGQSFPYFIGGKASDWIKREVLKKEVNRLSMKIVLNREVFA